MKKCIIFCAGGFDKLLHPIGTEDIVIAADGGVTHAQAAGLQPDILLGDFDSLGYIPEGAEVHPVEKDDTDAMLAIKKGLSLGCDTFYLYGALDGKRLEHTVANFQALQYLADRGATGYLVGLEQIVTVAKNSAIRFPAGFSGYLSVFCMGADADGVSIRGAKYEVRNQRLTAGFPLGVSNQFTGSEVTVEVKNGSLLLIWEKHNGIL